MHNTLTEHARCLYGDEYAPVPACEGEHKEHLFVERLTFAGADEIVAMFDELSPHLVDGYLPVWIRNLAFRLALLQRPDDPALLRKAAQNLWLHGPEWDTIAASLTEQAEALEADGSTPRADILPT